MCRAKAFNEALKVVDAGRQLENIQTMKFRREMVGRGDQVRRRIEVVSVGRSTAGGEE